MLEAFILEKKKSEQDLLCEWVPNLEWRKNEVVDWC